MEVLAVSKSRDVVSSLKKALDRGRPFDICILDIQMPDMNGYEVAQMLRKSSHSFRDIPLMAFSSLMDRSIAGGMPGREDNAQKRSISTQYSIREDVKHSVRILLAEDNPVNQRLAKMMLEKAGYHVEVADNGKDVLEKYTRNPENFDLIFMDIQMPKMDGYEVTRVIRERGFSRVPIIAMTASAMKGAMEKCIEAGMNDYITKPIRRERVLDALEKFVLKKGNV